LTTIAGPIASTRPSRLPGPQRSDDLLQMIASRRQRVPSELFSRKTVTRCAVRNRGRLPPSTPGTFRIQTSCSNGCGDLVPRKALRGLRVIAPRTQPPFFPYPIPGSLRTQPGRRMCLELGDHLVGRKVNSIPWAGHCAATNHGQTNVADTLIDLITLRS